MNDFEIRPVTKKRPEMKGKKYQSLLATMGITVGIGLSVLFNSACSISITAGTTTTSTTINTNICTGSPFYAPGGITFTGDPSADFGSGYFLFAGQGSSHTESGNTNGDYLYDFYVAFDQRHLYIGHKDPDMALGAMSGDVIKDLYLFINTGVKEDGVTALDAAGLSAAGMTGSFDLTDDIGTFSSIGKFTAYVKHFRDAPWSGRRPAAVLGAGEGQSIKLYTFVGGACTVYRFGQDEDAQGHDTAATAGWNNCVSNGVTEWSIPLSALYGTAAEYPKYIKFAIAVAGNADGMPAGTVTNLVTEWEQIILGTGDPSVDMTPATIAFDADSYIVDTADKTVTVKVTDAGLADTDTPIVTVTGGTPASYDVTLAWDAGNSDFEGTFTVGTAAAATADVQFSANGTLTVSYDDTSPNETVTASASVTAE